MCNWQLERLHGLGWRPESGDPIPFPKLGFRATDQRSGANPTVTAGKGCSASLFLEARLQSAVLPTACPARSKKKHSLGYIPSVLLAESHHQGQKKHKSASIDQRAWVL